MTVSGQHRSSFVRPAITLFVVPTFGVHTQSDCGLGAILRSGRGSHPGLHAEVLALHAAFAPHDHARLILWPGMAGCREVTRANALIAACPERDPRPGEPP
jgi:LysR family glycine cleavage system transcriptional activator